MLRQTRRKEDDAIGVFLFTCISLNNCLFLKWILISLHINFIIFKYLCPYATHTSDMIHVRVQINYKRYGIYWLQVI